jgi:restriction system protein
MDPIDFEKFVGQLFRRMGYKVETTAASGDEGIDLILRRGRRTAVVQCKRYGGTVGQPVVRDLYGTMIHTGADEAYLVTTGMISRAAAGWAEGKPIHLVDGHRLIEWTRTKRLNYDHRPALARSNRTALLLIGVALLAVMAIYLVGPETVTQVRNWPQAIYELLPGAQPAVDDVPSAVPDEGSTATATSTPAPSPTAGPTDTPLPTATERLPTPLSPARPTLSSESPVRPLPTLLKVTPIVLPTQESQ